MPPTLGIIFVILVAVAISTEIIPRGTYDRQQKLIKKAGTTNRTYEVKEGDTLDAIAASFGAGLVNVEAITDAATGEPPAALAAGMKLNVPVQNTETRRMVVPGTYTPVGTGTVVTVDSAAETADAMGYPLMLTILLPNEETAELMIETPAALAAALAEPDRLPEGARLVIDRQHSTGEWLAGMAQRSPGLLMQVLQAPVRGFQDKAEIIAFILILGGAFGMILSTGAVDAGLRWAVDRLAASGREFLLIPVLMVLFSLGGATIGMSEETIPFVMITVPLMLRLGYDSITGICISWLAAGLGFAGAFMNPFTVQVAQGIADLQPLSGWEFRLFTWVVFTAVGIAWVMWWARRVKRNPAISPTYENDQKLIHKFEAPSGESANMTTAHVLVLAGLVLGMVLIGYGVKEYGWYMNELSAVFMGVGVAAAIIGRLGMERAVGAFTRGASDLVGAALVVAFSAGIVIIMQENQVLDTILHSVAGGLGGLHAVGGSILMFLFQVCLNFFVPSGSGQAAMTMPIMAPLADLIGIERQVAVLAFQFGDGLGNMIIPTSAVTMAVLGIAEIPWQRWAKWVLPLIVVLHLVAAALLALAIFTGLK